MKPQGNIPDRFPRLVHEARFRFACNPERCDLRCCTTGHPLVLSPFEIQRISIVSALPYETLDDEYFEEAEDPNTGFPMVVINREKGCGFLKNRGCSIYDARPLVCRLFPVGKYYAEGFRYVLLSENECSGFREPFEPSLDEFMKSQDVRLYDRMWEIWVAFINGVEEEGLPRKDLFRAVFSMMVYNTDLLPAGISIEAASGMDEEDIFRHRLAAARAALPKLRSIFSGQQPGNM